MIKKIFAILVSVGSSGARIIIAMTSLFVMVKYINESTWLIYLSMFCIVAYILEPFIDLDTNINGEDNKFTTNGN